MADKEKQQKNESQPKTESIKKKHDGKVSEATTQPRQPDGKPNVKKVAISEKKSLYIMMPYIKGGEEKSFLKAAKHKKIRLKHLYPTAEYWIEPFTTLTEFKSIWTKIHKATSTEEAKYTLCAIHYFGHSGHDALYLQDGSVTYDVVNTLEKLVWHKEKGVLVLHSCRSGRYEDNPKDNKGSKPKSCIARALSVQQQTKVVGQMVYATFNTGDTADELKCRNGSVGNKFLVDIWGSDNLALWGYKSGGKVDKYKGDSEYKLLDDRQLWPSRLFESGSEPLLRLIGPDIFNNTDLLYI